MKRMILAAALAIAALFAFVAPASAQTQCSSSLLGAICANVSGTNLSVTVAGQQIIQMTLPTTTVTVKVPVPGPTVRLPGATVTLPGVTVPGSTITRPVPAPTTVTVTVGPSGQAGSRSVTIAPSTPNGRSTAANTPTATPSPKVINHNHNVTVTRFKAIGFSILAFILGALAVIAALLTYYYLGYKEAERQDKRFFQSVLDDLRNR